MEKITELRDRVATLPALEKRMAALTDSIRTAEEEVTALLDTYKQESRDVARIERESLSAFLLKTFGKYEDKLEKEQREELDAKLRYDRAVTRLNDLKYEKESLSARIAGLRQDARAFEAELETRKKMLSGLSGPDAERYAKLEAERQTIITQMTEIKEAQSAAARVRSTAESALESLKSAQGWATYDAFTRGGIFSHMAKYSHIDEAEGQFHVLASQIQDLRSELADVSGMSVSGLSEISSTQRAVDFWFDNIFTDLSVRGQIADNTEEVSRLIAGIAQAESSLGAKARDMEVRLSENKRRMEELLVSLS